MSNETETEAAASDGEDGIRIVAIAMDESEQAKYAYQFYTRNVRKDGDKVFLLHSVEARSALPSTQWTRSASAIEKDTIDKLMEEETNKIKRKLEQFAALLKESGVEGTVKSVHGETPGEGICKAVDDINASLVVMGTRGTQTGTGASSGQQRVVAIAMDGSDHAKYAFQCYLRDIRKENDKLYLIHSVETNHILHTTQWNNSPFGVQMDQIQKLMDEEKSATDKKLKQFENMLKEAGITGVVKSVHAESSGEALCRAAAELKVTIVIIGTRGMGRLRRTLIGSVSDYVLHHCNVPVVICKKQST